MVDETHADIGQGVPATWANRLYVWRRGDLVRIAFGEQVGEDDVVYMQAVMMTRENALALAALIERTAGGDDATA